MELFNIEDITKYLNETSTQEEKDLINSIEGKNKYEEFKKIWNEAHKELKDD
jgi:hypothetical protein